MNSKNLDKHKNVMTKLSVMIVLLLITITLSGQIEIFVEDFESNGNSVNGGTYRYFSPYDFCNLDGDEDYWGRVKASDVNYYLTNTSSGFALDLDNNYSGQNGDFYYAGEDQDHTNTASTNYLGTFDGNAEKTILISGINVKDATNMSFSGLFARGNTNSCGSSKYDQNDFVKVYYNIDCSGFVEALCFSPDLNCNVPGDISNEPLYHDPNCDGDGGEGTILTSVLTEFTFNIAGAGKSLDIKVVSSMNQGDEEIAFDYLRVFSDTPVGTVAATEMDLKGNGVSIVSASSAAVANDTDFGSVGTNNKHTHTFTIDNLGANDLLLNGISKVNMTGAHASDFIFDFDGCSFVGAGMSTEFTVTFKPGGTGTRTAVLSIPNNDADENPYVLNLQGTGIAPVAGTSLSPGDILIIQYESDDPNGFTFITFEELALGTIIYFTDAGAFTTNTFKTPFTDPDGYIIFIADDVVPAGSIISFGGIANTDSRFSRDFSDPNSPHNFEPASAGDQLFVFQDGDGPGGIQPSVNPDWIFLFQAATNNITYPGNPNSSSTQTQKPSDLTHNVSAVVRGKGSGASNEWDEVLFVGDYPYADEAAFKADYFDATAVPTGNWVYADQTSDPNYIAGLAALPSMGFSAAAPEIDITGQGMSIPDGDTSPIPGDDTDFGSISVGSDDTHTFTIKNTGDGVLTLDGSPLVAVSGTNASDFSVEVMPTSPVSATTGTTTFQVKFTPGAIGSREATLTIESDDADEDPYTFDIKGTGAACNAPAITNVTATPTAICVGGTITLTVTGTLGSAANWQWYSGNCGGTPVGTGTSVMVSPVTTTAYYVRGEGNCVGTTASCTSITPPVQPDPSISVSGATSICAGESTTLSYSSNGGISPCVNQWEISSTSAAAGFAPIGGATSSSYNTGALMGTRWYRVERSCTESSCNTVTSNVIEVTVEPTETNVTLDGSGNLDVSDVATSSDDVINLSASGMDLQVDDTNLCITGTGTGVVQVDGSTVKVPMASLTGDLDVMGMGGTDELNINGTIVIGGAFTADCEKINCKDGSFINAAGGTTMTGTIAPGNSPGIMTILAPYTITCGSTLEIEMRSATAGIDGYDQIVVSGSDEINISGVNLILSDCYTPELGDTFTIIDNQTASPIVGHFSDLSEGAEIKYNETDLRLSYKGGDGNDIVLTAVDNSCATQVYISGREDLNTSIANTNLINNNIQLLDLEDQEDALIISGNSGDTFMTFNKTSK